MATIQKELSFGHLLKVIFHRWKLLCSITAATMVVGTVCITLIYNPPRKMYSTTFTYNIPSLEDDIYIDGTTFKYRSLVSLNELSSIKESNDIYSNVDVKKMVSSGDVSIDVTLTEDSKGNKVQQYTINVKQKYFKNGEIAKSFLNDIANIPVNYTISSQSTLNRFSNLNNYACSTTFESQIIYLKKQISFLNDNYNNLLTTYGDLLINNKHLSEYIDEINIFVDNSTSLDVLAYEVKANGYSANPKLEKSNLESAKNEYVKLMSYNSLKIDELETKVNSLISTAQINSYDLNSYNEAIVKLTLENVNFQQSIDEINIKLDAIDSNKIVPESFTSELISYYNNLTIFTNCYVENEKEAVEKHSEVSYTKVNFVSASGGFTLPVSFGLSALLGLIIASIINLIIDRKYIYSDFN